MNESRLAAGFEASAFLRRAEQAGGFGTVLSKGDPERGALLLAISERGVPVACLVRALAVDGNYRWEPLAMPASDSPEVAAMLARRRRSDPDEWQIELDVPSAERFIAETTATG